MYELCIIYLLITRNQFYYSYFGIVAPWELKILGIFLLVGSGEV